ncbi:TetR/AcrR family transcriptional regulator [Paenibacillus sp. CAA11]|uniref:TetR/AcrR family transcriptional regulator n=1 Tax=Paenibacillus sp. CAA11 TaxID=1532905 RepID=UPI000D35E7F4|nr:TetR/AcrR family transcriptional regulator [Paenibacillus sp. CAA11]AWB44209.1 TetR/AcrR family transcriptional regulator [Paenibacillus sp. CAA11]
MRERIVEAASKEIRRRGLRFTMGELAKQLGISTKTIYSIFPSKDELIHALLNKAISELVAKEQEILNHPEYSTEDKLKKCLILVPVDFQFIKMSLIIELQRYYPKQWQMLDQFLNHQWDSIIALFRDGTEQGLFRPFNTAIFIDLYVGGFYRLIEETSDRQNSGTLLENLQDLTDILLSGILSKSG